MEDSCCRTRDHPGYRDLACLLASLGLALQFGFWTKKVSPVRESGIFRDFSIFCSSSCSPSPSMPLSHPIIVLHLKTTTPCFSLIYLLQTLNILVPRCIGNSYFHLESSRSSLFPLHFLPPLPLIWWPNPTTRPTSLHTNLQITRQPTASTTRPHFETPPLPSLSSQ